MTHAERVKGIAGTVVFFVVLIAVAAYFFAPRSDDSSNSSSAPAGTLEESAGDATEEIPSPDAGASPPRQLGSGSAALEDESPATADSEALGDRRIYRNSEDFEYLETAGLIVPGGMYGIEHSDGSYGACSFGWMVGDHDASQIFSLTAGHCGEVGDKVFVQSEETGSGEAVTVGEFVWQDYNGESLIGTGPDYALIEFYPEMYGHVGVVPPISVEGRDVELSGWRDAAWIESERPYMCRIGFRSGLSCGNFQEMRNDITVMFDNISDNGDSGGAILAFDPSDATNSAVYAVAVNSFGNDEDATTAGGKTIGGVMDGQDLMIYSSTG